MIADFEETFSGRLPQLHNIDTSSVALGVALRDKSGDSGTSQLRIVQAPLAEGVVVLNGTHEFRLRASRIILNSGSLASNALIGSAPASGGFVASPTTELSSGFEPYLSYRHQNWLSTFAGIGITPTGGVLPSEPVGNLGISQQFARGNWYAQLFSRLVRESILSYTGIVDPFTGRRWGRVRRSGLEFGGYTALGERWGASGKLQIAYLGGESVASNSSMSLSVGLGRDLKWSGFDYFTVGPEFSYDHFNRNLSHFTFGQGGYFSPQSLVSLGIAANFLTEEARQFIIKGRLSLALSQKREDASPCFPLGALLPPTPFCQTGFAANNSTDINFSMELLAVRRLSDHLQVGGAIAFRESPGFNDRAAMVFMRYSFGARKVTMSSDLPEGIFQSLY